jgi:hypothetical protein
MTAWLALQQNRQPHSDFLAANRGLNAVRWFPQLADGLGYVQGGFRLNAGTPKGTHCQSHMRRRYRTTG